MFFPFVDVLGISDKLVCDNTALIQAYVEFEFEILEEFSNDFLNTRHGKASVAFQ